MPARRIWQVLPLGPTGYGDSPYQCFSAFAGNPLLINLDSLVKRGYLSADDLDPQPKLPRESVDFGTLIRWKTTAAEEGSRGIRRRRPTPASGQPTRRFASVMLHGSTNLRCSWH